jgi:dihydropteroate synthase
LKRLQPVLPDVVALGIPVSIDSMKSAVVAWALDQGRAIANDVWGLQRDRGMAASSPSAARRSSSCIIAIAPIPPSTSCRTSPTSSRVRSTSRESGNFA